MIGIVVMAQGGLAREMVAVAEAMLGPVAQLAWVGVDAGEALDSLRNRLGQAVATVETGHGVVLVTDMIGATPCNLGRELRDPDRIELVTGANLPLLIALIEGRNGGSPAALVAKAVPAARRYIHHSADGMQRWIEDCRPANPVGAVTDAVSRG